MRNLRETIDIAKQQNVAWPIKEFYDVLDFLRDIDNIEISYWEDEENWAEVILKKTLIGYVWNKFPIIFILKEFEVALCSNMQQFQFISIISVNTLVSKEICVDSTIEEELGIHIDVKPPISMEDLWFYTNSN